MSKKRIGLQTVAFDKPPAIIGHACVVGKKEGEGPLRDSFDYIGQDSYFGEKSWEKAESEMQKRSFATACKKAGISSADIDYLFAGDLLNQCIASSFSMREFDIPFFGLYGACSTMAESLSLAALTIDGGFAETAAALTSSHFCTAERQFRFPLEYGGQRTPTAQWTATASGCAILSDHGNGPHITHITTGKIVDAGITDMNNMGAAMAPAAYDTLKRHFSDTGRDPEFYDLIVTGDLGYIGHSIVLDFFRDDGIDLNANYNDCGLMLFDRNTQDVHAGGSGCGCSAAVLCGHLLNAVESGRYNNILFAATGALMSSVSAGQGESIPGICHAVAITREV